MKLYSGYLPGLSPKDVEWETLKFGELDAPVEVFVPVVNDYQMTMMANRIKQNSQKYLKSLSVSQIIKIVDEVIARLLDRKDRYRQLAEKWLPLITGYDAEMVRLGLTGYLKTFRKPELQKFLSEDFVNPKILDEFQPLSKGGFGKAFGPDLIGHIWAGNVPGLPLWSLVSSLLVKSGSIGKVSSSEPLFAGWFANLLSEVEPQLAESIAIVWWKGGNRVKEKILLKEAELVIAYGNNETLKEIREHTPVTTRCLTFSHKLSLGMVSRAALVKSKAWEVAHQAAFDIINYDQQGCYSPQVFFVERGGSVSPKQFAQYIANELACFETKFPRRKLTIEEATGVALWAQSAELNVFSKKTDVVMSDPNGAWSAVYSDDLESFEPTGLNRTVKIIGVDHLEEVTQTIQPYRTLMQTVGIAAEPDKLFKLAELLGKAGVTRVSALEHMTSPEAGWHHDGRFNLLDLISITEIEHSASAAADSFAAYKD